MKGPPAGIFREYDIRGVVGEDLTPEGGEAIGWAFGSFVLDQGGESVAVGRDIRTSSPDLGEACIQGIRSAGCTVLEVGLVPTPALYYATHHLPVQAGVMVTGSHNPPEYNGFKLVCGGSSLYGEALQALRRRIEEDDLRTGQGRREDAPILEAYRKALRRGLRELGPAQVVVDCGNGMGGLVLPSLLEEMGCRVRGLYAEPDGRFPNHHPDPTVDENLMDLIQAVRADGAEVGVALDGDGDRLGAVDETGRIIRGDELLLLLAEPILAERPGAPVVLDVKCSQRVIDRIEALGGRPVLWKTGHSLIERKMQEVGAPVAGEMSGHLYLADRYEGFDDAIYAAGRLLELLGPGQPPLSERLAVLPPAHATPEIRVPCPDDRKFEVVVQAQEHFGGRYPALTLDGVRFTTEDGWALLRASNTQPVLVLRCEAGTVEGLERLIGLLRERLEAWGVPWEGEV